MAIKKGLRITSTKSGNCLLYVDANNLCVLILSQKLAYKNMMWTNKNIKNLYE